MSEKQPGKDQAAHFLRRIRKEVHRYRQHIGIRMKKMAATVRENMKDLKKEAGKASGNSAAFLKKRSRRQKQGAVAIALIIPLIMAAISGYEQRQASLEAYEVYMEGEMIGMIRDQQEFDNAVTALQDEMKQLYDLEAYIPEHQEFIEVQARDEELSSKEALIAGIRAQMGQQVQAVQLMVDGKSLAVLRTKEEAERLLEKIQEPYLDEEVEYLEVGFAEAIEIETVNVRISEIQLIEEALPFIRTGTNEEKTYEVASGDSSWLIAERKGMTVDEIAAANPDINVEVLSIGQELNLIVPKPYLTVRARHYVELSEAIPFETENVETDSMYEGDRRITTQGEEGKRDIKAYVIEENGVPADRIVLEEDVHAEPVTRVVAVGTKERPPTMATGTFINPTRGRLTSPFGMRGGRRHTGIDIANATGTRITSSDAGRVSFAGNRGAYGRLVIIDHENGYQTYYAHMNTIAVSAGERVHKDQYIGTVGSTGRSTGPHLHFEVRKNGTPVNPMGYVRY